MRRRVVITGLGAVTAAGEGAPALWKALLEERSGVRAVRFGEGEHGVSVTGAPVPDFVPEKFVTQRKSLKVMARDIQLAVAAAHLAAEDAGVREASSTDRERFGIIVGAGVLNHEIDELAYSVGQSLGADGKLDLAKFGRDGLPALFPLWLLKYLPNMPACHISILLDLQGPSNTLTTGPSCGLQAACEAYHIIRRGAADVMLAGGAESKLNLLGLAQYRSQGLLAQGIDAAVSRPFDPASQGLVVGEASAFVVLEELEHALARKASIYAEIAGVGVSSAAGRVEAMRAALSSAGITASEIDYLQACGLGVPAEDRKEAEAIEGVFGSSASVLTGVSKPVTGFAGYSSGAIDLVVSSMALRDQKVAPSAAAPASARGFRFAQGAPAAKPIRCAMTNAFGLGGQSVSVVSCPAPSRDSR